MSTIRLRYGLYIAVALLISLPAPQALCSETPATQAPASAAPAVEEAKEAPEPYDVPGARRSLINPHEQISDEGTVLWETCLICHKSVPDPVKVKSMEQSDLRFSDDPKQMCLKCHPKRVHPGAENLTLGALRGKTPNHLIVPPKEKLLNLRMALKETSIILPREPETGRIFCGTCHNPHERGVLIGRADTGADHRQRLRSAGVDICQYCHSK